MSGVTRCPKCATAFRISAAQLAARSGQARCGRCGHVFDARIALVPDAGATAPSEATRSAPRALGQASRPAESPRTRPIPELSPARSERSRVWTAAVALAIVALAAQLAFRFRSEMVLVWPAAKPALERLCAELGCEVPLPKRPELMSIEASDLQADGANPGVMVLTATLRNRASFPQQFPSLELTLTDAQDQALARRVLYARDYLGRTAGSAAGFAGNSELPVRVFIEATALKPTGYRLYLFFP
jgi:predicted Zn finger-like uncharacterized protein